MTRRVALGLCPTAAIELPEGTQAGLSRMRLTEEFADSVGRPFSAAGRRNGKLGLSLLLSSRQSVTDGGVFTYGFGRADR